MLNSLPKQTLLAKQNQDSVRPPANAKSHVLKLSALGFTEFDCQIALEKCNGHLDDAALWLTQNAIPNTNKAISSNEFPLTVSMNHFNVNNFKNNFLSKRYMYNFFFFFFR